MANGGVVTGELVLNTASFIASYDKAMQHIQNSANNMKNMANPIVDSMKNAEKGVNNSANNMEKKLNNNAKNIGASYNSLWNNIWNRGGNQAIGEFFNRMDGLNQKMSSSVEASGSRMINTWNGVMNRMSNSSNAGVRAIGNNLSVINNSRFDRLANSFEGTINRMSNIASAGARNISEKLQSGLSASDYMATIFGGMMAGNLWDYAQTLGGTKAMLGIKYDPTTAATYYQQEQAYTLKSSTSDAQINNLLKYVLGTQGLKANETYSALNAIDAAAATPDPVQRIERLRNYGQYLTTGYNAQIFRGDVTPEQAKILQAGDKSPQGRIQAMMQVAQMQGTMTKYGDSLSTVSLESLPKYDQATQDAVKVQATYNSIMAASDTIMRGMAQGFNDIIVAVGPLVHWFNTLDTGTQALIGKFVLFVGGGLVLASTLGILISVLEPVFGLISFAGAATASMALGLDMDTISALGFTGTLDYAAISLGAYILGLDTATTSQLGLSGMLDYAAISFVAFITGESAATVSTWSFTEALWASAAAILTNPIFWIAVAIIGVVAVIYELGKAWGWWTDLAGMGAAVMARLGDIWNGLVWAGQQLWGMLSNLGNIWNVIVGAFYDSEGNFLGLFAGFQNLGGMIWNWLASIDWAGLFAQLGGMLQSAGQGIWTYIFGGGQGGSSLVSSIVGFLAGINWGSVFQTIITGLIAYNPITLIIRLLFGDKAANAFINGFINTLMIAFNAIVGILTWVQGALGNTVAFFQGIWTFIFGGGAQKSGSDAAAWIGGVITNIVNAIQGWLTSLPGILGGMLTNVATWVAGAVPVFLNTLFILIGHYNPLTLITQLLFGDQAAQNVQNNTVAFLWALVNTFVQGLTNFYNTVVWIGTTLWNFFSWLWTTIYNDAVAAWNLYWNTVNLIWTTIYNFFSFIWTSIYNTATFIWNTIYTILTTIWNILYTNALIIWNAIYGFFSFIWNSIYAGAIWVWNNVFMTIWGALNRIWTTAVGIGTSIYSTVTSVFTRIYNTVSPIFTMISNAFNKMRDGLVNAANWIKDKVWSPIKWLYDKLAGFWNWLTHPFGGGNSGGGGSPAGGYAGGPDLTQLNKKYSTGSGKYAGFFAGVMGAVYGNTERVTGLNPANTRSYAGGYAGGYYGDSPARGNERLPDGYSCLDPEGCYAGDYDFSQAWIDNILKIAKGWHMNINGDLVDLGALDTGNIQLFQRLATDLISPTHYEFYYNSKYNPGQALKHGAFNCWDGAQIMIGLARSLGLEAHMAKGYWGNTNTPHVWAMVENIPFDTTAFQQRRSWFPPPGSMRGTSVLPGVSGGYAGGYYSGDSANERVVFDFRGAKFNTSKEDTKKVMEEVIEEYFGGL